MSEVADAIKAEEFKPEKKGKSDFYSWQLYRWLKKYPYYFRVFKGTWNPITGHDIKHPILYIGAKDGGWFHGRVLRKLC